MITIEIKDNLKTSGVTIHMVRNKQTRMEKYFGDKIERYIDTLIQQYVDKSIYESIK